MKEHFADYDNCFYTVILEVEVISVSLIVDVFYKFVSFGCLVSYSLMP